MTRLTAEEIEAKAAKNRAAWGNLGVEEVFGTLTKRPAYLVTQFTNGFPPMKPTKVAKKRTNKQKEVVPTEHEEQCKVIAWADSQPEIAGRLFAIPNGSHKSPASAAKFKLEGLRSGVPDLFLPMRRGTFCGLFVEMKRTKGSVTSEQQTDWHRFLNKDYAVAVCKGANEAIAKIKEYLCIAVTKEV